MDYSKPLQELTADFFIHLLGSNLNIKEDPDTLKQVPASTATGLQKKRMLQHGYFPVASDQLADVATPELLKSLRSAICNLVAQKWPATFVFLANEAWVVARRAQQLMIGGDMELTCDFLAWHIDQGQAGFSPHRDRQPNDLPASFYESGFPKYCTMWMALSNVSSENSCLMVIPASNDPGYHKGDSLSESEPSPLEKALASKHDYQNIRCFTGGPGSAWIFSHRIIHWGSSTPSLAKEPEQKTKNNTTSNEKNNHTPSEKQNNSSNETKNSTQNDKNSQTKQPKNNNNNHGHDQKPLLATQPQEELDNHEPRVSISFVGASPSFEPSYLKETHKLPSFSVRVALVAAQMICYHERFDLDASALMWYYEAFRAQQEAFRSSYVQKVLVEFCFGVRERPESEKFEEIEEALMEAMVESGWQFEDDFDEEFGEGESGQGCDDDDNDDDDDDDNEEEEEHRDFFAVLKKAKNE